MNLKFSIMEQNNNKEQAQQTESDVKTTTSREQGRQPESAQEPAPETSSDISQVDQQEGQMNNGELGGNFDSPSDR